MLGGATIPQIILPAGTIIKGSNQPGSGLEMHNVTGSGLEMHNLGIQAAPGYLYIDLMEPQVFASETPPPHGSSPSVPQTPAQKVAEASYCV